MLTENQKTAMANAIHAKAEEYADNPDKGFAAGYSPEQVRGYGPAEVGRPRARRNTRSEFTAWLYGVARKDLPPGRWRIDEAMGEGPASATLVIL